MLDTCFGTLRVTLNGMEMNYSYENLPCRGNGFLVDARYRVSLDLRNHKGQDLEIVYSFPQMQFNNQGLIAGAETGEDLAALTLSMQKKRLTIGTIGDIPKVGYRYDNQELTVKIPAKLEFSNIICYVAWEVSDHEIAGEDTWLAADPTLPS